MSAVPMLACTFPDCDEIMDEADTTFIDGMPYCKKDAATEQRQRAKARKLAAHELREERP